MPVSCTVLKFVGIWVCGPVGKQVHGLRIQKSDDGSFLQTMGRMSHFALRVELFSEFIQVK